MRRAKKALPWVLLTLPLFHLASGTTRVLSMDLSTGYTFTRAQTVIFGIPVYSKITRSSEPWPVRLEEPRHPVLAETPIYAWITTTRHDLFGKVASRLCGFAVSGAYARIQSILADPEQQGDRTPERVMYDVFMEHRRELALDDQPLRNPGKTRDDDATAALLARLRPPGDS